MPKKLSTESAYQTQDSVRTELENSSMSFNLTESDKKLLRSQYDVVVFSHDCNPKTIDKRDWPWGFLKNNPVVMIPFDVLSQRFLQSSLVFYQFLGLARKDLPQFDGQL